MEMTTLKLRSARSATYKYIVKLKFWQHFKLVAKKEWLQSKKIQPFYLLKRFQVLRDSC